MFPDDALQKSEGGTKEDEKIFFRIYTSRFSGSWSWPDCVGNYLFDFEDVHCISSPKELEK